MATANYAKTSPYVNTGTFAFFLDIANIPQIPYVASDTPYVIDAIYKNRPDLLAYDLYGGYFLYVIQTLSKTLSLTLYQEYRFLFLQKKQ
jgi:hypothetical protein